MVEMNEKIEMNEKDLLKRVIQHVFHGEAANDS